MISSIVASELCKGGRAIARSLRIEFEGAFHHVINRGYHQMDIFIDQEDFSRFLDDLSQVFNSHLMVIHSYCLMNNHFHLFTETPKANLQESMHRLQSRYASYFKKKYDHVGKVFERRYKAILVDSDSYALELSRYIHRNPVGVIVSKPNQWNYSSFNAYQDPSIKPIFLDTSLVLNFFAKEDKLAIEKYQQYVCNESKESDWDLNDQVIANSILGTEDFIKRLEKELPKDLNTQISGLIKLKKNEQSSAFIKQFVAQTNFAFSTQLNLILYGLKTRTHMSNTEINHCLGLSLSPSSICGRIQRIKSQAKKNALLAKSLLEISQL